MDSESLSSHIKTHKMKDCATYEAGRSEGERNWPGISGRPGICVPHPLSQEEYDHICRCFRRANVRVEGYLDCAELMTYMNLRRCPITQWEAGKILEYADSTYNYYITLEQVLNLAIYFGIGTQNPLRLTKSEFEVAIRNAFRSTSNRPTSDSLSLNPSGRTQQDNFDFEDVVNFFESKAVEEQHGNVVESDSEQEPERNEKAKDQEETAENDRKEIKIQFQAVTKKLVTLSLPPTESESKSCIDEEPLLPVKEIKKNLESKIKYLISNNADDFLVKLSRQQHPQATAAAETQKKITRNESQSVEKSKRKISEHFRVRTRNQYTQVSATALVQHLDNLKSHFSKKKGVYKNVLLPNTTISLEGLKKLKKGGKSANVPPPLPKPIAQHTLHDFSKLKK